MHFAIFTHIKGSFVMLAPPPQGSPSVVTHEVHAASYDVTASAAVPGDYLVKVAVNHLHSSDCPSCQEHLAPGQGCILVCTNICSIHVTQRTGSLSIDHIHM